MSQVRDIRTEISDEKTIEYLKPIFSRKAHISSHMRLTVPGFGKVMAESTRLFHREGDHIISYFRFEDEELGSKR